MTIAHNGVVQDVQQGKSMVTDTKTVTKLSRPDVSHSLKMYKRLHHRYEWTNTA